jgi:hypothetical protein
LLIRASCQSVFRKFLLVQDPDHVDVGGDGGGFHLDDLPADEESEEDEEDDSDDDGDDEDEEQG